MNRIERKDDEGLRQTDRKHIAEVFLRWGGTGRSHNGCTCVRMPRIVGVLTVGTVLSRRVGSSLIIWASHSVVNMGEPWQRPSITPEVVRLG